MYLYFFPVTSFKIDKILSLIHGNKISDIFQAIDISKSTEVIIDISLKGKKNYNQNMMWSKDDNFGYVGCYDEIFDYELGSSLYTCAVLKFQCLSLDYFAKDGFEKMVFFFFINFLAFL
jgi:UDP-galactopyranose mutase